MTQEEMQAKLGLDATSFERSIREIKVQAKDLGEHTHKSFLHASNGAREFHKVLHGLNETVPGLGYAFQALTSPIGAAFGLAVTGFTLIREKLKEWNKEMDEAEKRNAEAVFGVVALRKWREEVEKAEASYRKFQAERNNAEDAYIEQLKQERDLLAHQHDLVKDKIKADVASGLITKEQGEGYEKQVEEQALMRRIDLERKAKFQAQSGSGSAQGEIEQLKTFKARAEKERDIREGVIKESEERLKQKAVEELSEKDRHLSGYNIIGQSDAKKIEAYERDKKERENAEAALKKAKEQRDQIIKDLEVMNEKTGEAEKTVKKYDAAWDAARANIFKAKVELDRLLKAPVAAPGGSPAGPGAPSGSPAPAGVAGDDYLRGLLRPTWHPLAGAPDHGPGSNGTWMYPPGAAEAKEIFRLDKLGDPVSTAKAGRLRDQLDKAGLSGPHSTSETLIKTITNHLNGDGVPVKQRMTQ